MDYINIPKWISKEDIINSRNLSDFFESVKISYGRVEIKELRDYYMKTDDEKFRKILEEMALRGLEINIKDLDNIEHSILIGENPTLIKVKNIGEKFKTLDFSKIYFENFIDYFNVTTDKFFNNIPIDGFLTLNKNITKEDIMEMLRNSGFYISEGEENLNIGKVEDLNFSKRASNCLKREGIIYIEELLELDIETLSSYRNMGEKTINEVYNKIEKLKKGSQNLILNEEGNNIKKNSDFSKLSVRARNVLEKNSIMTIEELICISKLKVKEFRNVGEKTAKEISDFMDLYKSQKTDVIKLSENILKIYGDIEVKYLKDSFLDIENLKIKDFQDKCYKDIFGTYGSEKTEEIFNTLEELKEISDIFKDISKKPDDIRLLEERFIEGKTLKEIGENLEVTRERVRQKEKHIVKKIIDTVDSHKYFNCLKGLVSGNKTISANIIQKHFLDNELFYFILEKSKESPIYYYNNMDCFFFSRTDLDNFEKKIFKLLKSQEEVFKLYDVLDDC